MGWLTSNWPRCAAAVSKGAPEQAAALAKASANVAWCARAHAAQELSDGPGAPWQLTIIFRSCRHTIVASQKDCLFCHHQPLKGILTGDQVSPRSSSFESMRWCLAAALLASGALEAAGFCARLPPRAGTMLACVSRPPASRPAVARASEAENTERSTRMETRRALERSGAAIGAALAVSLAPALFPEVAQAEPAPEESIARGSITVQAGAVPPKSGQVIPSPPR